MLLAQFTEPKNYFGQVVVRCVKVSKRYAKLICKSLCERDVRLMNSALVARYTRARCAFVEPSFHAQFILR